MGNTPLVTSRAINEQFIPPARADPAISQGAAGAALCPPHGVVLRAVAEAVPALSPHTLSVHDG